ncbi:MAG: dephospho-CoA kinase [Anaerolineales bacterium]|nr:dephospho-CoA kinase [Anaerolineales bacterium]
MDNQPPKLIIGLTGNIATGKSAVMRLAASRGALTIDADKVVHDILAHDPSMQAAIAVAFGSHVRKSNGQIDRAALGQIVFNDSEALRDLEMMLHPAVRIEITRRLRESDARIVMIEAIKLLEGGLSQMCHQIWVTRCAQTLQIDRMRICRGMALEEAVARIKAQPPQEEKVAQADVVIDTGGLMRDTERQFDLAWQRLPSPDSVEPRAVPDLPPPVVVRAMAETPATAAAPPPPHIERPKNLDVRRARPSDISSILLLIQKATSGAVSMKRGDLLLALGERSYFIGQIGAQISAIMGWVVDDMVGRIDQIYLYPLDEGVVTGTAVLEEIEQSAQNHIAELIIAALPDTSSPAIHELFQQRGYQPRSSLPQNLPRNWQAALGEAEANAEEQLFKVLRPERIRTRS